MALVNPQIAMSYRPTVEYQPRNALADATQIMSLQQAQMQMDKLRQTDEAIERIRQVAMKEGGPSDTMEIAKAFLSSPVAEHQSMGFKIYQQQKDKADFERVFGRLYPELTGGLTPAPANALVPPPAAANALVPPPAPAPAPASVNAMAPAGKTADQLRQEIIQLSNLNDPRAKALADVLKEQLKELTKTHTVGGQIVTGAGGVIHTAPSPIGMLESEIAALQKQGVPDTDPRIVSRRGKIGQLSGAGAPLDITRAMTQRDQLLASGLSPDHPDVRALNDFIRKQTTHAPGTTVNISTERKYGERFSGLIAEADAAKLAAAENAPNAAATADRVMDLIATGKVITGTGANVRLQIAKGLNLAGGTDSDKIKNTEVLISSLAETTLGAIKSSNLGAGQGFTNADRDFLEKAKAGQINYDAKSLTELARLSRLAAEKSAEAWNNRVKQIPSSALEGTGISTKPIVVPKRSEPKNALGAAPTDAAPAGVDPALWKVMTPQERALWLK